MKLFHALRHVLIRAQGTNLFDALKNYSGLPVCWVAFEDERAAVRGGESPFS